MTTQEIAGRYVQLANQSKWEQILDELHADSAVCREPEHVVQRGIPVVTEGKEAIKAKGAKNRTMIQEIHSQSCSEPVVAGNFFTVALKRDVTFTNRPRVQLEEIGLFQVKDGRIISEQFYY
jgi:limonene-1,2-epoxide hydrolase